MQDIILSIHRTPIRLTDERWAHITEEHCELAGYRIEVLETVQYPIESWPVKKVSFWRYENYFLENTWRWFIENWRTTG